MPLSWSLRHRSTAPHLGQSSRRSSWSALHGLLGQLRAHCCASPTYAMLDREGVIGWVHEGSLAIDVLRLAVLAVRGEDAEGDK